MPKFLRRNAARQSRLGKNRKKKQVWRSPKGRHNQMRLKRKGYPATVNVGYRSKAEDRGKIDEKKMVLINNMKELENLKEGTTVIFGKIGNKKKLELIKKAKEKKIHIHNVNVNKMMKKIERAKKLKEEAKKKEDTHKKHEKKEEKKSEAKEEKKAEEKKE